MSIEQRLHDTLVTEAEVLAPVPDVAALVERGQRARRDRRISVGVVVALVAVLVAATGWLNVHRDEQPVAPDRVLPELPVLWTVPVDNGPEEAVVDPATRSVFVSDAGMAKVSVIDTNTLAVVEVIDVGISPRGLALDGEAGLVFVVNADVASVGSVSVIDTDARRVVRTVPLGEGTWPVDVAVDRAHHRLFVTESNAGAVAVVDTRTWQVVDTVAVGGQPRGVAVDPRVGEAYVANGETVSVIDTGKAELLGTIPVPHPATVATDPAAGILVVDSAGHGTVTVVKTRTHEVVRTIRVGGRDDRSDVQVDSRSGTAYVTAGRQGALQVIDLDRLELVARVSAPIEGGWFGQAGVHPATGAVYAPLGGVSVGVIAGR